MPRILLVLTISLLAQLARAETASTTTPGPAATPVLVAAATTAATAPPASAGPVDGSPATLPSAAAPAPATTPGLVMAMDRLLPGATDSKIKPLLADEARAILNLYLAGTVREWYFRQDRPGAVFILDTSADNARRLLGELPLVKAGLVSFDIIPIGPYIPLATLLRHDEPARKAKARK
jgi:hypothetical protein